MKYRKRMLTLLETLISLALASIVMVSLLWIYHGIETLHGKQRDVEEEIHRDIYVQERLEELFYRLKMRNAAEKQYIFYTDSTPIGSLTTGLSLVFTHHNSGSEFREINAQALSRLYVDTEENLTLASWPIRRATVSDPTFMHKEVLATGVKDLAFYFYIPPMENLSVDPGSLPVGSDAVAPYPNDSWRVDWPRQFSGLPAIIAVEWKEGAKKKVFAYPLSEASQHPTYRARILEGGQ